jgi:amino acid adenylation domain-containing protein
MLAQPEGAAGTWEILGESERQSLAAYNATAQEFPAYRSFQQLFELQVERTPDAIALVYGDEQFSYAQLNARANNVARHLLHYGVGPENTVALCLERSPLMLIALLGVLKTGAAYLPLDVQAPARRLRFILEDAQVSAVITQNQFRGSLPEESEVPIWCLDTEVFPVNGDSPENPPAVAHPENLVYVIYTSGSTGNPKGVMIENRGLLNYLSWAKAAYRMGEGSRTLVHSPFSFDLTITGLLLPLIAGGTVELVSQGEELERLCNALADLEQHYALIKLTPSHLQVLSSWLGERTRSGRVDALIIGGEALPAGVLTVWQQQSPETRLINEYGPTETVVGCSTYEVPAPAAQGSIAIGRPIGNMQMYVLDEAMRRVPAGVVGEIYIGGEQVARGYLNQTALTAERFVPDPFSTEPGKRLYRSGDLGRMRADGEMEYLGRTDEQVKIKGFRIELGEVETVLRQHELVKESAAVVQGTGEEKRLLGYVVLSEENVDREQKRKAREEIRSYLRRELPEYMVPRDIIVLDRMRLTANGKIDRQALPLPSTEPRADDESYDQQLSPAARALSKIWCEFLNLERVGVNENFFALGGDSILAVQIAFKAKQLGFTFHPVQLFRHPTIAQLETVIAAPANASNTQETVRSVAAAKQPNQFRQSSRVSNY